MNTIAEYIKTERKKLGLTLRRMSESYREALVFIRDIRAGVIFENEEGYVFKYEDSYLSREDATAVSVTMPLTIDEYISTTLFPFFDGLIPEGWLQNVACRNWKIRPNDRFGLLLAMGRDPIGNVSVIPREVD